jgi:hypothetical protein
VIGLVNLRFAQHPRRARGEGASRRKHPPSRAGGRFVQLDPQARRSATLSTAIAR